MEAPMIIRTILALMAGLLVMASSGLHACDETTPCEIKTGSYHLALPDHWDGQTALPAIVFFHGHRSSGRSVMNGSVRSTFGKSGYAVIAPNGPIWPDGDYRYWPGRPLAREGRDDIAFTEDVVNDVAGRIPLDRTRILVSGFSAGGSMAWMIACYRGDLFAGYVSVAGALRRPAPSEECPGGPARMLHIHGFADAQVPLEGRAIRDWHQGDVFASLDLLRTTNGCESKPSAIDIGNPFWCRQWTTCTADADISFCLHDGGHGMPKGWATIAKDWFER